MSGMGKQEPHLGLAAALAGAAVREGDRLVLPSAASREIAARFGQTVREIELKSLLAGILPARYLRNMGTVGWAGQLRLQRATVAVIGCGGLGGWVIEGLARTGVGRLVVADCDVFTDSNLNRQLLCTEATLARPKAEVARERVAAVNSTVEVIAHQQRVDAGNLPEILAGADAVVDALDHIPLRLALQDAAGAAGVPLVHGAIAGFTGQVMTILPGDPGLRLVYPGDNLPEHGVERSLGNPAATPMMVAAWQVQEVVKLLLGRGELLRHRLLVLDAEGGSAWTIDLEDL